MSSKFAQLNITEERLDLYWKLKYGFDVLVAILHNEEVNVVHRLRAVHTLSEVAKTLWLYLLDEEKLQELEQAVNELKQLIAGRDIVTVSH